MSIFSSHLLAQHASYLWAHVAYENACVTYGFVVPLETRLDVASIWEMVLCAMQLGCGYCTGHSVAICVSTVPCWIWIWFLPTAVALELMPVCLLSQGCFQFWRQLGETLHSVALCDDDIQDHLYLSGCVRNLESQQEKAAKCSALRDQAFSLFYFKPNT